MTFPQLSEQDRISRLQAPAGKARMVLDTDTYNEIDDQFALTYALLSPDKLSVEAIYAAPFHNSRSNGPGDGMEKSYEEILRLLEFLGRSADGFAYRGSIEFLGFERQPQDNAAVRDLIEKAMSSPSEDPLYVVAIGAITNVASALLLAPEIVHKIVVVWLGGHHLNWPHTREFNLAGGCAGGASRARQRRTLCDCALHGRDLSLADHAARVASNYRRDQSGRRLSLPDLQGISTRFIWGVQRNMGYLDHCLAAQQRLGAEQSSA